MGDGVLMEFGSAVNAVACAVELQDKMTEAGTGQPEDRRIVLRIGINLGDVVVEGGDLYGDGVIIAARLQALAGPGDIWIAASVHDQIITRNSTFAYKGRSVDVRLIARDLGVRYLLEGSARRPRAACASTCS